MIDKVIALYAIIDDILKAIGHSENRQLHLSDAEVLTTALVVALCFSGNQTQARNYLMETGLMPGIFGKSRFCRRLHAVSELMMDLFHQLGSALKQANEATEYLLDSFAVALCDNIRIPRCHLVRCETYQGYIAAKKRYFYGVRVHLPLQQLAFVWSLSFCQELPMMSEV